MHKTDRNFLLAVAGTIAAFAGGITYDMSGPEVCTVHFGTAFLSGRVALYRQCDDSRLFNNPDSEFVRFAKPDEVRAFYYNEDLYGESAQ